MKTEFEATFMITSKEEMRKVLASKKATLVKKEYMQKRAILDLPKGHEIEHGWVRVRDEADKITLALKVVHNNTSIENQKEIQLKVDSFDVAVELMTLTGCVKRSYQENLRERWELDGVEITIDEWPFIEPYIEIEGDSEQAVKVVAETLGFKYEDAYFGSVDGLYSKKYGITEDQVNNETPKIVFDMENPFLNRN